MDRVGFVSEPELLSCFFGLRNEQVWAQVKINSRFGAKKVDELMRQKVLHVLVDVQIALEVWRAEDSKPLTDLFRRQCWGFENAWSVENVVDKFVSQTIVEWWRWSNLWIVRNIAIWMTQKNMRWFNILSSKKVKSLLNLGFKNVPYVEKVVRSKIFGWTGT